MLRQLRKELDAPDLIVVLTVNPHFERGKNPYVETIIEHQKLLARTDPRVAYVDATPAGTADRFHFDSAGITLIGEMIAQAALAMARDEPSPGFQCFEGRNVDKTLPYGRGQGKLHTGNPCR